MDRLSPYKRIMGNENKRRIEENKDKNAALTNLERGLDKYESATRSDMETYLH